MYKYFIAFTFFDKKGELLNGNVEYVTHEKINDLKKIQIISENLEDELKIKCVVINNFFLF